MHLLVLALIAAQQRGFSDPAREARLRAAFPAVDSIMREFTEREHVPAPPGRSFWTTAWRTLG